MLDIELILFNKLNKEKQITPANMRSYFSRQVAKFERLAISIKFVTAERKAVSNAARKYTAAVSGYIK